MTRPLAITTDPDLLDELLRLAAAAAVELEVAADPAAARPHFRTAPLVLIGHDSVHACHRARLPRRAGIVVVGREGVATLETATLVGAEHTIALSTAESWLTGRLAAAAVPPPDRGRLMAIIGGRGGAGASVLAAAVAVTARQSGLRTLLVDADPLGGGLDLVLGWEGVSGLRWPAMREAGADVGAPELVGVLPQQGDLAILSWDRGEMVAVPPVAMVAAVEAGREGRDLVVVDLPRRLDDAAIVALNAADRAFLVVPAEIRAIAAAHRVVAAVKPHCPRLSLVVRGPAPGSLTPDQVAASVGLPLVGTMRPDPQLATHLESGAAPAGSGKGPLAVLCRRIIGEVVGTAAVAA